MRVTPHTTLITRGELFTLLAAVLILFSLSFFSSGQRQSISSTEARFTDASAHGLSIVPASCPSAPHFVGECGCGTSYPPRAGVGNTPGPQCFPGDTMGADKQCHTPACAATCPNGSAATIVGNTAQCTCAQGNMAMCNQSCPDGSPAPGGNAAQCTCAQGNQSACGGGGPCPTGQFPYNGSCMRCPIGYRQEGNQCVFDKCPQGYWLQGGQCIRSCSAQYYCSGQNLRYQDASCSDSLVQQCAYGCAGSACSAPPSPSITLWQVSPILVQSGETVNVKWTTTNIRECTVTGTNGDSWSGTSGTRTSSGITGQTIYTIFCTGLDDSTVSEHTTVNIVPGFKER